MEMDLHSEQQLSDIKLTSKPPVIRGARACTTCRAAKMKCVGAEDGQKQCQRCKRANVDCVFEKHRRGRKPGSKLSEASKMLRRLEKGLNNAKLKSQTTEPGFPHPDPQNPRTQDSRYNDPARGDPYASTSSRFSTNQLPPLLHPNQSEYTASSTSSQTMEIDEDDETADGTDDNIFPSKLISRENQRNSFFRTILNPEEAPTPGPSSSRGSRSPAQINSTAEPAANNSSSTGVDDPIACGMMSEEEAKVLFDMIFLRLNPFINLFDPVLHSVSYVRSKSPFLFTVLLMAGCKFFKPELFKACQKLANEFAVKAFCECWKSVEVVQAFACLTYWRDPDDNRTWTFIGYACRMAVELGLNRYVPHPPPHETEVQLLERRNRERTYLVLFVHDRSLSTQTGRNWMLPEDDFVRHADTWHDRTGGAIRPEDVIVAAFVPLRHIAAETTEIFHTSRGGSPSDINYEYVLLNCNSKLTQWGDTWVREMKRAGGEKFHFSFLSFFRLYVRLFTNSFGIQDSLTRGSPSVQALSLCYTSAIDSLRIVSKDFASMSMLRYGQDSITIMSAYSAVFLVRLLRSATTLPQLHEGAAAEAHTVISKAADAYHEASVLSPTSSSAAYHARFLRGLLANDIFRSRKPEKPRYESGGGLPLDPRLQGPQPSTQSPTSTSSLYSSTGGSSHDLPSQQPGQSQLQHFTLSPRGSNTSHTHGQLHESDHSSTSMSSRLSGAPAPPTPSIPPLVGHQGYMPPAPQHSSELDAQYWRNMFLDLGYGGGSDGGAVSSSGAGMNNIDEARHQPQNSYYPLQASYGT